MLPAIAVARNDSSTWASERASNRTQSRHRSGFRTACLLLLWLTPLASQAGDWRWIGQNGFVYEDNTNHAARSDQRRHSIAATQALRTQTTLASHRHHALRWNLGIGAHQNLRYPDLSRIQAESGVVLHIQPGAGFHVPHWSAGVTLRLRESGDALRDASEALVTLRVASQLTTRVQGALSAGFTSTHAQADVFSNHRGRIGASLDWQALAPVIVYLKADWLDGEFTTTVPDTGQPEDDWTLDTAYDVRGERAYQRSGSGAAALVGMNWSITRQCALDLAIRRTALNASDQTYRNVAALVDLIYRF
ncbi:hypothetical protein [uncultured Abyssibacter sp.]|uniref:hypothetical protein n=1 Tax=uncultured Abyssibacter sp. TaxID=2320202 RepID=UPI0032B10C06